MINGYVGSSKYNTFAVGSLMGITTFFSDGSGPGGIHEICIKPFFHSWPRFTALLGKVYGSDALHFRLWKGGVVFANGC